MRLILILLLTSSLSHAEDRDTWACTDEATTRSGRLWTACGVGEGMDEGEARSRALNHALDEFKSLCDLSSDCKGLDRTIQPKRTTCSVTIGWWKCYRMVEVRLEK